MRLRQMARTAGCGRCHAGPLEDCWPPTGTHLARFIGAWRDGLLTDTDLMAVMQAITVITWASALPALTPAGAG